MLNERLQILVSREQRRRLEAEARRRGASVASLIREAIDAQLGTVAREERLGAAEAIGRMDGGTFLPPEELDRVLEQERDEQAGSRLRGGGS
jgi:predicted DNA-binding protein